MYKGISFLKKQLVLCITNPTPKAQRKSKRKGRTDCKSQRPRRPAARQCLLDTTRKLHPRGLNNIAAQRRPVSRQPLHWLMVKREMSQALLLGEELQERKGCRERRIRFL